MSVVRVLLLLVILTGVAGLGLQNLSPAISLVFLGLRSQPLPLAFLLLGAIAAGVITGLILLSLLALSNYFSQRRLRSQIRKLQGTSFRSSEQATNSHNDYQRDDFEEFEDFEDEPAGASGSKIYEAEPGPRSGSQSGSTYSYGFRDSNQSGVGQRESVFDAEYREVKPPNQSQDLEDYGFDNEEDDFNWDEDRPTDSRRQA